MLELSTPATSAFLPQFHLETKYKQGLNPQQSTALTHTQRLTAFFVKDQIASVLGSAGYKMSLHGFFFPPLLQPFKNAKCILGLLIVNSETQAQGEIFHVPLVSQNQ